MSARIIAALTDSSPRHGGNGVKIEEIEGVGAANAGKLREAGIRTTDDLLERGAKRRERELLAGTTGISPKLILEWVNHADLMRLTGVGSEFSDLLEAAGVDSPAELAQRNPDILATTFLEVVAARPGVVRRSPSKAEVEKWIAEAKTIVKVVEH
jgi:predicted flap endonuclease-1-like 5' DNA nuclease